MSSFGPTVSASWLAEHLYDDDLVVVDSRWSLDDGPGRDAYAQAHIATAVFADLDLDLSAPPSVEAEGEGRLPVDGVLFSMIRRSWPLDTAMSPKLIMPGGTLPFD